MQIQESIAEEISSQMIGSRLRVIVDRIEGNNAVGRSEFDSPEVDPEIILSFAEYGKIPDPGDMVMAEITATDGFDLIGNIINSKN